jgi:hypothetical protein
MPVFAGSGDDGCFRTVRKNDGNGSIAFVSSFGKVLRKQLPQGKFVLPETSKRKSICSSNARTGIPGIFTICPFRPARGAGDDKHSLESAMTSGVAACFHYFQGGDIAGSDCHANPV